MKPNPDPRESGRATVGAPGAARTVTLFEAGHQAVKARGLLAISLFGTLAAMGWTLWWAATVVAAGGGQVARGRLELGLILSVVFGILAIGMTLYAQCYVTRVEITDDEPPMQVHTLGLFRDRREAVHPARVVDSVYRIGDFGRVSAPWWTVRVRGRSLPLVIDAQGEVVDRRRLLRALSGRWSVGSRSAREPGLEP